MTSMQKNIIYQGNSVISVETLPEYSHPVVIKKPSKSHPSQRSLRSLEKEYEMTRSLDAVEGVRKALGQQSIENQKALILEYIDGETDYTGWFKFPQKLYGRESELKELVGAFKSACWA